MTTCSKSRLLAKTHVATFPTVLASNRPRAGLGHWLVLTGTPLFVCIASVSQAMANPCMDNVSKYANTITGKSLSEASSTLVDSKDRSYTLRYSNAILQIDWVHCESSPIVPSDLTYEWVNRFQDLSLYMPSGAIKSVRFTEKLWNSGRYGFVYLTDRAGLTARIRLEYVPWGIVVDYGRHSPQLAIGERYGAGASLPIQDGATGPYLGRRIGI